MRRCIAGIRALQKHWRRHRNVFVFAFPNVPPPYAVIAPPNRAAEVAADEAEGGGGADELKDETAVSSSASSSSSSSSSSASGMPPAQQDTAALSSAAAPGSRKRSRQTREPFRPVLDHTPLDELHQQRMREIEAERRQRLRNIALRKQFDEQEAMVREAEEQAVQRQRAEEDLRRLEAEQRRVERLRVRAALTKARAVTKEAEQREAQRREMHEKERQAESRRREQQAADARERKLRMQVLANERQRAAQRKLAELADAYRCRINLQWKASLGCVKAKVRIKLRLKSKAIRQGRIRQAKENAMVRDTDNNVTHSNRISESSLKARLSSAVGWARRQMSPSPSLMEKVGFSSEAHSPMDLEAFPDDFEEDLLDEEMILNPAVNPP